MPPRAGLDKLLSLFRKPKADGGNGDQSLIPADALRRVVDPRSLGFASTADLDPADGLIGQERALRAIQLGVNIRQQDFNLFVLGPAESGKSTAVTSYLQDKAKSEPAPSDWVYVNNFDDPDKPKALPLPRGRAERFSKAMIGVIDELKVALPAVFEGDDYRARRRAIEEELRSSQESAVEQLSEKARGEDIALLRTPTGFGMAPMHDGKVIKPEVFETLTKETREQFEKRIEELQKELMQILENLPRLQREGRSRLQSLNEEVAGGVVRQVLADVEAEHADVKDVAAHLVVVKADLISNVALFLTSGDGQEEAIVHQAVDTQRDTRFRRYLVNVVVTSSDGGGAPIIEEDNPTYGNLIGRVDHIARMGALLTDFLLIKPGSLHRANGGYLLLDARKVLTSPFAWEALKRALKSRQIEIESPAESMGLISTVSVDPEPIPLNVKVILFGDRTLYYLLCEHEPDFNRLFKVQADFDESIDATVANQADYARLIASIVKRHALRHVDAAGAARLIEEGSRLAEDNEKLSLEVGKLADVLREADYWASAAGHDLIMSEDVIRAIEERLHRSDRVRDRMTESFARDIVLLGTEGAKVGQINGLSVLGLAGFSFGRPSRITARVRMGSGRVTDIEREVELGGPLHSKGVMILWGFLAGRYALDVPLALAASLVFEQSYGGVDGDSASSAELYALLSALAEVPIKQSFAVTGSVNQLGEVQAIGGVNQKIEGFYDICRLRGLDGSQGVLIPASNVQHLMLRNDVVEAVREGKFKVHAVASIDQGIELLTGVVAGERGKDGRFPEGSINRLVEDRLRGFALAAKAFGDKKPGELEGKAVS